MHTKAAMLYSMLSSPWVVMQRHKSLILTKGGVSLAFKHCLSRRATKAGDEEAAAWHVAAPATSSATAACHSCQNL